MVPAGPELVDVEFALYLKYQVSNHHDDPCKVITPYFLPSLSLLFPFIPPFPFYGPVPLLSWLCHALLFPSLSRSSAHAEMCMLCLKVW